MKKYIQSGLEELSGKQLFNREASTFPQPGQLHSAVPHWLLRGLWKGDYFTLDFTNLDSASMLVTLTVNQEAGDDQRNKNIELDSAEIKFRAEYEGLYFNPFLQPSAREK